MLFNSYAYILGFLPVVGVCYFLLCATRPGWLPQAWLVLASLYFYGYWNAAYLPLILGSIAFNFLTSRAIWAAAIGRHARIAVTTGIAGNLLLLGYFKYTDFGLQNVNVLFGTTIALQGVTLPLGISFFTFTQIAFLVDTYRRQASRPSIVNYALFVSYFPHLLAGPILHHSEMMPQFEARQNWRPDYGNIARGLFLFSIGLAKKVLIADSLAEIANAGYQKPGSWQAIDAWLVSLAYALQLYFDFSGYTDMAIGASRVFNIHLPVNFNTPYRASSIQDFWRRWHMTLSRFLREYLYIPLGGNRRGRARMLAAIVVTFVLGGIWHGAGWTFVVWGALHGAGLAIYRVWEDLGGKLPRWAACALTFLFVNVTWVYFRARSLDDAHALLAGMAGLRGIGFPLAGPHEVFLILAAFVLAVAGRNSNQLASEVALSARTAFASGALLALGVLSLARTSEFLYFNF